MEICCDSLACLLQLIHFGITVCQIALPYTQNQKHWPIYHFIEPKAFLVKINVRYIKLEIKLVVYWSFPFETTISYILNMLHFKRQ